MSTSYPSGTDSYSTHSDATNEVIHASTINNLQDAVVALETELGANPRGSYSTVAARLAAAGNTTTYGLTALGNSGTSQAIPAQATVTMTLTANCTLTFPTVSSGSQQRIRLQVTQDATGSRTVTWPTGVSWAGGLAPALSVAAGSTDIIEISTVDGGTSWTGVMVGQNLRSSPPPSFLYDASLITGVSDGATVTTWADTSGNSRDVTQATSGNRPTYIASAIGGKPALRFDGSRYLISVLTPALNALSPDGTFTVIAVAKPTLSSGVAGIVSVDPNANSNRQFQLRVNYNGGSPTAEGVVFTSSAGSASTDSTSSTINTAHVYSLVRSATTAEVFVDGASDGATAVASVNTTGSAQIAVGSTTSTVASNFVGDIAYIAMYQGALTTTQRQAAEAALIAKYMPGLLAPPSVSFALAYYTDDTNWTPPSDGGTVGSFPELQGNRFPLVAQWNSPTYQAANPALNGNRTLNFAEASEQGLRTQSTVTRAQTYSIVAVLADWDAVTGGMLVSNYQTTSPCVRCGPTPGTARIDAGTASVTSTDAPSSTGAHLWTFVFNGASSKIVKDGVSATVTATPGTTGFTNLFFICNREGTENGNHGLFGTAKIAFLAMYAGDFTADTNYAAFKTWAATKYGLTIA